MLSFSIIEKKEKKKTASLLFFLWSILSSIWSWIKAFLTWVTGKYLDFFSPKLKCLGGWTIEERLTIPGALCGFGF